MIRGAVQAPHDLSEPLQPRPPPKGSVPRGTKPGGGGRAGKAPASPVQVLCTQEPFPQYTKASGGLQPLTAPLP